MGGRTLADLVRESGLASEAGIQAAAQRARHYNIPFALALVEEGHCGEVELVELLRRRLQLSSVDAASLAVEVEALREVGHDLAVARCLLPFALERQGPRRVLRVAVADPFDRETLWEIEATTGCRVEVVLAEPSALEQAIERAYRGIVTKMIPRGVLEQDTPLGDLPEQATEPGYRVEAGAPLELRFRALLSLLVEKGVVSHAEYGEAMHRLQEEMIASGSSDES